MFVDILQQTCYQQANIRMHALRQLVDDNLENLCDNLENLCEVCFICK